MNEQELIGHHFATFIIFDILNSMDGVGVSSRWNESVPTPKMLVFILDVNALSLSTLNCLQTNASTVVPNTWLSTGLTRT